MLPLSTFGVLAYPHIDPVFLSIGPVQLHWYGLAYVAGILLGWLYGRHLVSNRKLWPNGVSPITKLEIDDAILYLTLGIVLGGRLGYVIFYDPAVYLAHPLQVFSVWDGGMAFHGGLVGVTVAIILFCKQRGVPFFSLIDVVAAAVPFGLFFGRIANFINGELWGSPSNMPWAMVFPTGGPMPRHPSQLYEAALEGILLWIILRIATHVFKSFGRPRLTAGIFILCYGIFRIMVEAFWRMPDKQLGYLYGGWLTMGMVLSIPMLLVGLWAIATAKPKTYEPRPDDASGTTSEDVARP
ncbi:prolipoprotein diacylglyceryl transferase [Jiella sp. MQZ9-1]|uniref:Phosphatidylglycerol--prolipoprotein diacylglyceryl transferase n=1 Tax=Jiella flava TaxID=2816857 RepID=A0A939G1E9_9HYPH|nr:prolipoprotein diacylglyceryl transferase [Jiella flava]MBO0664031.1 prolipoprotein diacylglyceryl transferase [Jiella flava]MCD2472603.1 prolipoprotein diacylglyceryl transferase [Jiella flava]